MPNVYIGMTIDILHHGHINIINEAKKYGDITIGLLTDSAIAEYKRLPYLSWEQRKEIIQHIDGVKNVVPQEEWDYSPNIRKFRPDFMVHGTDWLEGPMVPYRKLALEALDEYGGQLIEVPYTKGISSSDMFDHLRGLGTTPDLRRRSLKRLISANPITRIIEAHNPISALIAEKTVMNIDGKNREFHGFWSSSLTDSTARGKPDIEALEINSRLTNINEIFDVTTKPMIIDADTGGKIEHFELNVRSMERLGISAAIIEDKTGLKKNSLFGTEVDQTQDSIENFCEKIRAGREARVSNDFMVIARTESLILEKGMNDALERANSYIDAGVDGIMIHSRKKTPDEVFEFSRIFRENHPTIPLVGVPSSYNITTEDQLIDHGFDVVIYANHLMRAAFPAMKKVAVSILEHGRAYEAEEYLMSISDILELIPGTK